MEKEMFVNGLEDKESCVFEEEEIYKETCLSNLFAAVLGDRVG